VRRGTGRLDGRRRRGWGLQAAVAAAVLLCGAGSIQAAGEPARRPQKQEEGAFAILETLIETPGLSGREERVRDAIRGLLPAWADPEVDAQGNLLVGAGPGAPSPEILIVAHMDETGYAVASVRDDGLLEVRKVGGFFDSLYEGQVVLVRAGAGDRGGVVVPRVATAERRRPTSPQHRCASTQERATGRRSNRLASLREIR